MKRALLPLFVLAVGLALAAAGASRRADPGTREWVQLFDGKSLDGWDVRISGHDLNDNFGNTFRVENGLLKTAYEAYGPQFQNRFGHIFYRQKFSYYIVAAEYRFVGEQAPGAPDWAFRNSGIMVHSQSARSMTRNQDFPISIEVQLLGGRETGERPTGNVCTPGTEIDMNGAQVASHCVNSTSKTIRGGEWVRVEAEVRGAEEIVHRVNGETVLTYQKPRIGGGSVSNFDPAVKKDGMALTDGYVALQSESHPIEFRKVELLNLVGCTDKKATNYKTYFVKSDNSQCRY
jgi:hypothetical protein